jgi:hypothetical protein
MRNSAERILIDFQKTLLSMPLWMWLLIFAVIGLAIVVIWFLFRPTINVTIWMILLLSLGFLVVGLYFAYEDLKAGRIADTGSIAGTNDRAGLIAGNPGNIAT